MKIQILSDLHNEFIRSGVTDPKHKWSGSIPETDADLIILAGDIDTGTKGAEWAVAESNRVARTIVYVPGNHEFYGYEYFKTCDAISSLCKDSAVHCLNPGVLIQGDLRIIGATLWTDYRADVSVPQDLAMYYVEKALADHRKITFKSKTKYRRFLPADAWGLHLKELSFIEEQLETPFPGKTVVVSHHGPHPVCQHPDYPVSEISSAFHSDLSRVIERYDVDIWVYGHTHANLDTVVFDTRIISNQAGYPGENVRDFDAGLTVEL
jgi:predicted phosphodiesterase